TARIRQSLHPHPARLDQMAAEMPAMDAHDAGLVVIEAYEHRLAIERRVQAADRLVGKGTAKFQDCETGITRTTALAPTLACHARGIPGEEDDRRADDRPDDNRGHAVLSMVR